MSYEKCSLSVVFRCVLCDHNVSEEDGSQSTRRMHKVHEGCTKYTKITAGFSYKYSLKDVLSLVFIVVLCVVRVHRLTVLKMD